MKMVRRKINFHIVTLNLKPTIMTSFPSQSYIINDAPNEILPRLFDFLLLYVYIVCQNIINNKRKIVTMLMIQSINFHLKKNLKYSFTGYL